MNDFQEEIYKTIDILVQSKLAELGFDKTKRGKVVSTGSDSCVVEIDGDYHTCKVKRGITVVKDDVVQVEFPQNNSVDKYVKEIVSGNGSYSFLEPFGVISGSGFIFDCGLPGAMHDSGVVFDGGGVVFDGGGVDGL